MGMFGNGRALNFLYNRYNNCNCLQQNYRRLPEPYTVHRAPIFGGMRMQQSFTFKTNIWDFFSTAMMSASYALPSIFGAIGSLKGSTTPQGAATTTTTTGEDKSLANLVEFYGSKYTIKTHPTKSGIYQAVSKNGGVPIEGTFDELCKKLGEATAPAKTDNESPTEETAEQKLRKEQDAKMKEQKLDLEYKDGKWMTKTDPPKEYEWDTKERKFKEKLQSDSAAPGENDQVGGDSQNGDGSPVGGSQVSRRAGSSGHRDVSPAGYYRAAKNDGDGQVVLKAIRPGMSARQVTDIILNNKMNYLGDNERNALAKEIELKNPSIFKNGKVIENFPADKLDIPTIDHIKKNFTKDTSGMKSSTKTGGSKGATGTYTGNDGQQVKVEKTVTSPTGRTARKINGKWHYYAKDGTELNEAYIKNPRSKGYDPELIKKTRA